MGDPTRFLDDLTKNYSERNSSALTMQDYTPEASELTDMDQIVDILEKRLILTAADDDYSPYFSAKESLFDAEHIGTFHQQVGLQLLEQLRTTSDKWWPTQKFGADGDLLENAYRFVQYDFFKKFFTRERVSGKKILDLGCGTGFYSRHFLENGAKVTGVDPNSDYISIADKACADFKNAEFKVGIVEEGSDCLRDDDKFDIIYISDMFLFYTKGIKPNEPLNPGKLLNTVKKHLSPTGVVYLTEPHGIFWQTPWMGSENRPYTIVTEYLNKKIGVTPTLSELSSFFSESGLSIVEIHEPTPEAASKQAFGERAFGYSTEFPLWWTFILTHKPEVII